MTTHNNFETIERLPAEAYTGLLGEYVELMQPTTEAPPEYHFGAFATVLGLLFADSYINGGAFRIYPTLFTLLIGPTGLGRKTTVARAAVDTLHSIAPDVPTLTGEGSRQGMLAGLIRVAAANGMPSIETSIALRDGRLVLPSPRAIGAAGVPTLIRASEFTKVLKQSGRAGTSDLTELYLELFDHPERLENNSMQSPMTLLDPSAALLGDSTEEALSEVFTEGNVSNGFLNRLAIVRAEYTGDPIPRPVGVNSAAFKSLTGRLSEARAAVPAGATIGFTKAGGKAFDTLYLDTLAPRMRSGEGSAIAREGDQLKRFAMLYALQDGRTIIDAEDVQRAWQVALYLSTSALHVAGSIGANDKAKVLDYLLGRIAAQGVEGVKTTSTRGVGYLNRLVSKHWRPRVRRYGLNRLMVQLVEDGEVMTLETAQLAALGAEVDGPRWVATDVAHEARSRAKLASVTQ